MKGYFNNEEANRESFDGDWFCTGDVVTYDEEEWSSDNIQVR